MAKYLFMKNLQQKTTIMKKQNTIRTLLGVTQEDIAMLLGVSRGQWSMYEIGRRDLPLAAKQLLAELLTHLQSPETINKGLSQFIQQDPQKLQLLERLLCENKYQQLRIARKITALEKKHAAKLKTLQVVDFITHRPQHKSAFVAALFQSMTRKASQSFETESTVLLIQYKLRQELLVHEKLLLESKLKKLNTDIKDNVR